MSDEQSFPSTRWVWKKVKVTQRPQGTITARRSRSLRGFRVLPRSNRREYVTIRVKWRGGAESWWLVEARGKNQALPGWMALEDVMSLVHNEQEGFNPGNEDFKP